MTQIPLLRALRAKVGSGFGRELARAGIGMGGMRAFEIVLGIANAILLARQLGITGLGLYSVAIATVTLAGLPIEFGFPALVTRETARAHAVDDWDMVRAVLFFAVGIIVLIAMATGAAVALCWPWFRGHYAAEQIAVFVVAMPIPLLSALANVCAAGLRGIRRPLLGTAPTTVVRSGALMLSLGIAALIAPGWLDPQRAAALSAVAAGIGMAFAAVALAWHAPRPTRSRRISIPARAWLLAAFTLGLQQGTRVAREQATLLIVGTFGSVEAAGLYRIAQRGAIAANFGYTTMVTLIAPYLVQLDATGDRARLQRLITASARAMTAVTLIPFAVFLFFGGPLLAALFGADFAAAQPALVLLTLGFVLICALGPAQTVIVMLNRERVLLGTMALCLAASVVLAIALIGPFGAAGAAAADAFGLVLNQLILWYLAWRMLGLRTSVFGR